MNNINKFENIVIISIKKYLKEVIEECKKLVLPTKKDVYATAIYIGIIVLIAALAITFTDFLISQLIKIVMGI